MFLELSRDSASSRRSPILLNIDHVKAIEPASAGTYIEYRTTTDGESEGVYVTEPYETVLAAIEPYVLTLRRREVAVLAGGASDGSHE